MGPSNKHAFFQFLFVRLGLSGKNTPLHITDTDTNHMRPLNTLLIPIFALTFDNLCRSLSFQLQAYEGSPSHMGASSTVGWHFQRRISLAQVCLYNKRETRRDLIATVAVACRRDSLATLPMKSSSEKQE